MYKQMIHPHTSVFLSIQSTSPTSLAPSNEEGAGEGAESETDKTTQKFLHILANFLDGEVRQKQKGV